MKYTMECMCRPDRRNTINLQKYFGKILRILISRIEKRRGEDILKFIRKLAWARVTSLGIESRTALL
jgi:hypothetical protein